MNSTWVTTVTLKAFFHCRLKYISVSMYRPLALVQKYNGLLSWTSINAFQIYLFMDSYFELCVFAKTAFEYCNQRKFGLFGNWQLIFLVNLTNVFIFILNLYLIRSDFFMLAFCKKGLNEFSTQNLAGFKFIRKNIRG